jgi:hypothetical protein
MAERIFTIPINEAFDLYEDLNSGCPLCRLRDRLEEQTLSYTLGAAMMEPDVRIEMNRAGFCNSHFKSLYSLKNKLALGLILESHLDEVRKSFDMEASNGRKPLFGSRKPGQADSADETERFSKSCFICSKIHNTEVRYYSNTVFLWESDVKFREKLRNQPYFCISHFSGLLKYAKTVLKTENYTELYSAMTAIENRYFERLRSDVSSFCVSFDHRNIDKPLTEDEKMSIEHAMKVLK